MRSVRWLLPVAFGLCLSTAARSGAWLYPEGKGQLIIMTTFATARGAYDSSGQLIRTPAYRKLEAQVYLEHGVTDWLTFLAQGSAMNFQGASDFGERLNLLIAEAKSGLPLTTVEPPGPAYRGLGLGAAGVRIHLFDAGHYTVSVETSVRAASAEARRFLDMRDATQIDARLLIGRPFTLFGFTGFVDTQLGVRTRGQNGDEARLDMTVGVRPLEALTLMAQSFSAVAPRGGASTFMSAQKFQLSAVYELTPAFAVQIGAVSALGGANSPAERGIVSGLWWRY